MYTLILVVHVIAAIAIVVLILLQQGKGASMGASFGAGASQTIFGSQGSGNFFSRMTAIIATVFFITSFGLAYFARENAMVRDVGIPVLEQEIPEIEETSDVPVLESPANDVPADVPEVEDTAPAAEADVPEVEQ